LLAGLAASKDHSYMAHPHVHMPTKAHKDITTTADIAGAKAAGSSSSTDDPAAAVDTEPRR
jgi:hypothetical protein